MSSAGPGGQGTSAADRELAYQANNLGVALLEQYRYADAATSFRRALEILPSLGTARLNLAIALFYDNQQDNAVREVVLAIEALPESPRPRYVSGLIARQQNRLDEAASAFARVLDIDGDDVGSLVYLGQLRMQERRFDEAIENFRRAQEVEPHNATAAYNLAVALTRSGARDEGQRIMQRFQQLRDSAYATTFSQVYLEQGRYGEALASTGAEADLVDSATPEVKFADVTAEWLPGVTAWESLPDVSAIRQEGAPGGNPDSGRTSPASLSGGVSLVDVDRDGDLDLLTVEPRGVQVFENDGRGRFRDVTSRMGLASSQPWSVTAAVAGDLDNDTRPDLFVLTSRGHRVLSHAGSGRFVDITDAASVPAYGDLARTAALVDADHDGDLDVFVVGLEHPSAQLLRNNGNRTFSDATAQAGLTSAGGGLGIVPTDFDNRRDIDLLVVPSNGPPALFQNLRDGSFKDVASTVGLPSSGDYTAVAAGDVNKDGFVDFFFGRSRLAGALASSAGAARFVTSSLGPSTTGAVAAQFVDYDNDGLLDLLALDAERASLLRNLGTSWADVTAPALGGIAPMTGPRWRALATGDLDADGDEDVVVRGATSVRMWRNDGAERRHSIVVHLSARVSNRSAAGAKVEMRAGSLRQRVETSAVTPQVAPGDIVFGLGSRFRADVVRVLWPAGILQAEMFLPEVASATPADRQVHITELDRKPSSCPYLFTWNGQRFEFITDFLGGGEMGAWLAPGVRNVPDSDEYVRIAGDRLRPRGNRFELRITNELEEALFLDRVQLVAVDHPASMEIFPNEGLTPPPFQPPTLYGLSNIRPLRMARDDDGRSVLDRLEHVDRIAVDGFERLSVRGYAAEHRLSFDPGPRTDTPEVLLLTGWTDYAFSSDNVAASQSGLRLILPRLEGLDPNGGWRTLVEPIGFPVGRPQTVVVPLPPASRQMRELRLVTSMRIHWDRIRVASSVGAEDVTTTRMDAATADLRWRGYSAEVSPDGREPFAYDYQRVSVTSPWKVLPGLYTREGDVRALVRSTDDMFVVSRTGDELAVSFDAAAVPALAPGRSRTFLLFADGFSKEMDINSSDPDRVGPLPFHGMSAYPYPAGEAYPTSAAHRAYLERYNTRRVSRAIPSLDITAAQEDRDPSR